MKHVTAHPSAKHVKQGTRLVASF